MGTIIFIIFYILNVLFYLWYFASTKHEKIPLILVILDILISIIPVANIIMFPINIFATFILIDEDYLELKENWFNKTFLAYRG